MNNIVVLCGSTRFKPQFEKETRRLTLEGRIVLTLGIFTHSEGIELSAETKKMLKRMQYQRIDMASRVHVINGRHYDNIDSIHRLQNRRHVVE
jgi:dienelactone hydrolase